MELLNTNFLQVQSPVFWRECSIFTHSLLVIGVLVSWLWKVVKSAQIIVNRRPEDENNRKVYLWSFIALFGYNLLVLVLLFCLHYIYYFNSDHGHVASLRVILFDFMVRAVAWLLVVVYLQCNKSIIEFRLLVTIWWGFYLVVYSYCLVTQLIHLQDYNFLVLVLDIVYGLLGILLLFVFCWNSSPNSGGLQQPLLVSDDPKNSVDVSHSSHSSLTKQANCPYSKAGFLSNLTFYWVGSLILKGYHKTTLNLDDIPPLSRDDDASESYKVFRKSLENAKGVSSVDKVTTMQLAKSLIIMSWPNILWTFILSLLNTLAIYVGPYLIDSFVQYLSGVKVSRTRGYVLISAFLVAKLVECVSTQHLEFKVVKIELKTRAALTHSIYTKALILSCASKEGSTSGEMINIMSVDAEKVGQFVSYMHDPWLIVLQLALALSILYTTLGLASIAAFVATVLVMLCYYPVSKLVNTYYKNLMQSKDQRMKVTTEILKNMKILKLQAWDMKFLSKIYDLRKVETKWLKKTVTSMAVTVSVFWIAPTFVSMVTFSTCMLIGVPLESGKVLSAIATLKVLQYAVIDLPNLISTMTQTRISLSRIASFLSLNELGLEAVVKLPVASNIDNQVVVEINGGNFTWDQSAQHPTLKNINIKVEQGMRIAICGTVGSGKSTLLSCILEEVPKISGVINVGGSTAYVPQTAWIQSGSIADNILFGKEIHVERYNRVLEACCLTKDLEVLSFGDQTIIGERGINLSGGQKQRIQIARALYQDADIYILDEPFSAVDAHTGTHLFKECIQELLKSKTVIYVTHQVEFLRAADLILVMKEGSIQQAGTYKDILNSGTDLKELVAAHEQALSTTLDSIGTSSDIDSFIEDNSDEKESKEETNNSDVDEKDKRLEGQLVQEEEREKGRVKAQFYWKYLTTAYKGTLVPIILLSQILFQLLQISSSYWIAWATRVSDDANHVIDGYTLLIVYAALAVGSSFCILVRSWLQVLAGYMTASSIFYKMHFSLFRAPMSFFDATPSGRILSRVSTDQASIDTSTPTRVGGFAYSLISLLAVIGVMSLVVWQVYMIFIPVFVVSLWYQKFYIASARELSRLIGVNKAPVIQHFSESISGASVIRSFGQESRFCETSTRLINDSSRPTLYYAASNQWLNFRLDMLSLLIFACTLIFLISIPVGSIDPVIAGLAVAYALNLSELQNRVISNFATMENKIISVERVLQYTGITSEASLILENNRPNQSWPFCGEVHVQDLQVRYAPHLPLVLRGLTCTFQGGKTSGIVGRTGCGKSTLIQALFRIVEPVAGKIIIDDIDISSIGLHDLRSRLSIIPQDPTMFQGTLRSNLDPLEEYTDEQIMEALDKCQLGDEIRNRESKLDSNVSENGENWSVGQRQLICLGRVLLKRSKVLVLDEATASVDTATDNLIQQTLKEHFSDSTLIVVAHRITSVINSDQVIVLDHGVVEECDIPSRLLLNHKSSFSKLVNEYTTRSKSKKLDTRVKKQSP